MKKPANFPTFIIIVITLFLKSSYAFADSMPSVNDLLDSLDNALNQRTSIMAKQQTVINDLRRGLDEAGTPDLKTSKYEQLYSAYLHINGDTAIYYALQATNAAEKTTNPETILKARFCLLRAYTRQGAMGKANEVVNSISDIESVAPSLRPTYADLLLDFYTRLAERPILEKALIWMLPRLGTNTQSISTRTPLSTVITRRLLKVDVMLRRWRSI